MTRSDMRAMLRRRLQEDSTVAAQWTDATLNDLLNLGLLYMQKKIMAVDPCFVIYTATTNLVADQAAYAKPANFIFEMTVKTRSTPTADWDDSDAREYLEYYEIATNEDDNETGYSIKGRFIVLNPAPGSNVTNGLQIEYVPSLSMAVDTDVPDITTMLHEGIVYRAQHIALGDTDQDQTNAAKDLEAVVADIPLWYMKTSAPPRVKYRFGKWAAASE